MTKTTYTLTGFIFDNTRKGAKYSFDGEHFKNSGEFLDCALRRELGYTDWDVKDSTHFSKDSDISDLRCSIKSGACSLYNEFLGDNFADGLAKYFELVQSTMWAFCTLENNVMSVYTMTADEFCEFATLFGRWDSYKKKVKIKAQSKKMCLWLNTMAVI